MKNLNHNQQPEDNENMTGKQMIAVILLFIILSAFLTGIGKANARPGDLVFFKGTMGPDVPGVTHVGIYVGNGWMIHCGDPIGYANLNTSYWQSHFYAYGRLS